MGLFDRFGETTFMENKDSSSVLSVTEIDTIVTLALPASHGPALPQTYLQVALICTHLNQIFQDVKWRGKSLDFTGTSKQTCNPPLFAATLSINSSLCS